jgi:predicted Zn-dependent peptidase
LLVQFDLHGLDSSYLNTYMQKVQAVTPEEVQRIAQTYLKPENMTIVIVGNKAEVKDTLKEFGPITE